MKFKEVDLKEEYVEDKWDKAIDRLGPKTVKLQKELISALKKYIANQEKEAEIYDGESMDKNLSSENRKAALYYRGQTWKLVDKLEDIVKELKQGKW